MSSRRQVIVAASLGLTALGAALAQGAPGAGAGPRQGAGPAGRWGSEFTPGWSLMTPQERREHQERMRSMKTYEECKAYQDQHREQMAARAKERGGKALARPRRDACAGLK